MIHHLKIKPEYFEAIINDEKPFEIRYNDRNFQEEDKVILEEYLGEEVISKCPFFLTVNMDDDFSEMKCYGSLPRCGNCNQHIKHKYSGRRCLVKIKKIFNLNNASEKLTGFIAFTFKIIAINGRRQIK